MLHPCMLYLYILLLCVVTHLQLSFLDVDLHADDHSASPLGVVGYVRSASFRGTDNKRMLI